jgi:hypothetical protein
MRITIDRFEGDFAVIELPDKSTLNVPRVLFPDAAEGDVDVISKKERKKTRRLRRIQRKFDRLRRE